jgi:hypothetical protein
MAEDGVSRRYFFHGSLLAGVIPAGGFGTTPSLKSLGYKSPNEKLNLVPTSENFVRMVKSWIAPQSTQRSQRKTTLFYSAFSGTPG